MPQIAQMALEYTGDEVITLLHYIATPRPFAWLRNRVCRHRSAHLYTQPRLLEAPSRRARDYYPRVAVWPVRDMDAINAVAARHRLPVIEDPRKFRAAIKWHVVQSDTMPAPALPEQTTGLTHGGAMLQR